MTPAPDRRAAPGGADAPTRSSFVAEPIAVPRRAEAVAGSAPGARPPSSVSSIERLASRRRTARAGRRAALIGVAVASFALLTAPPARARRYRAALCDPGLGAYHADATFERTSRRYLSESSCGAGGKGLVVGRRAGHTESRCLGCVGDPRPGRHDDLGPQRQGEPARAGAASLESSWSARDRRPGRSPNRGRHSSGSGGPASRRGS